MKQYVLPAGGWGRLVGGAVVEREVVTEAERRARVLEAAALEIEVRGWHQGSCVAPDGRVCLFGGVLYAAGMEPDCPDGIPSFPDAFFGVAADVWGRGHWSDGTTPLQWNDEPGRTAADVTFLLRWRAEEIRDGWDDARIPKGSLTDA